MVYIAKCESLLVLSLIALPPFCPSFGDVEGNAVQATGAVFII
jgi:hypothetical protein